VSNVAPYAETSTTDNVPYAEFPQARQKRAGELGSGRESRVGFRIEARAMKQGQGHDVCQQRAALEHLLSVKSPFHQVVCTAFVHNYVVQK